MDQDFKSVVKETLATHTTKLENIESQLKSIDSSCDSIFSNFVV